MTVIDWDYVANLMESLEGVEGSDARREYLETRGFDVMSIVRGLVDGLDRVSGDPVMSGIITGALMAGMEIAVRVMESRELDDRIND